VSVFIRRVEPHLGVPFGSNQTVIPDSWTARESAAKLMIAMSWCAITRSRHIDHR
jgi:hypothetical protein